MTPPEPAVVDAAAIAPIAPIDREMGPFEISFAETGTRKIYFVAARSPATHRLLASLHGVCNPPGYTCGHWSHAASELGFLVCPEGDGRCSHAQFDAPTWTESIARIDADLERSIAAVRARYPDDIDREGAVLTGFSKGAYAAVEIAKSHPGRWPYLVLNEADVHVTATQLREAKVRAIALLAGEVGGPIGGMKRTQSTLEKEHFPARLWVMKQAGHFYSEDIDSLMREAVEWVVGQ